MELHARHAWTNAFGRKYFELLNSEQAEELYAHQKYLWTTFKVDPDIDLEDETAKQILAQQTSSYEEPGNEPLRHFLEKVIAKERANGESAISILEIGCLNGNMVRHFDLFYPDIQLTYTGIDAFPLSIRDAANRYPEHKFLAGTAEDFVEMTEQDLGMQKFDLFVTSGVLCTMLPPLAKMVLKKASEVSRAILCRDYLANRNGHISAKNAVMMEVVPNHQHILFANPLETFTRDLGLENLELHLHETTNPAFADSGAIFVTCPD